MYLLENNPNIRIHKKMRIEDLIAAWSSMNSLEITGVGDLKKHFIRAYLHACLHDNYEAISIGRAHLDEDTQPMIKNDKDCSRLHGVHFTNAAGLSLYIAMGNGHGTAIHHVTQAPALDHSKQLYTLHEALAEIRKLKIMHLDLAKMPWEKPDLCPRQDVLKHESIRKTASMLCTQSDAMFQALLPNNINGQWIQHMFFSQHVLQQCTQLMYLIKACGTNTVLFAKEKLSVWRDFFQMLPNHVSLENDRATLLQ